MEPEQLWATKKIDFVPEPGQRDNPYQLLSIDVERIKNKVNDSLNSLGLATFGSPEIVKWTETGPILRWRIRHHRGSAV